MKAGEFIIRTFHVRTAAHVLHLKSRSYSQHMALREFYEEIVEQIDDYAEGYQGQYGLIDGVAGAYTTPTDPVSTLGAYRDWVVDNRKELCGKADMHLSNIVDEIVALTDRAIYKLTFLK